MTGPVLFTPLELRGLTVKEPHRRLAHVPVPGRRGICRRMALPSSRQVRARRRRPRLRGGHGGHARRAHQPRLHRHLGRWPNTGLSKDRRRLQSARCRHRHPDRPFGPPGQRHPALGRRRAADRGKCGAPLADGRPQRPARAPGLSRAPCAGGAGYPRPRRGLPAGGATGPCRPVSMSSKSTVPTAICFIPSFRRSPTSETMPSAATGTGACGCPSW